MINHILEGIGILYLIAMASLSAGLLRSAKAASQVTEEQEDALREKDDEHRTAQQNQKNSVPLQVLS